MNNKFSSCAYITNRMMYFLPEQVMSVDLPGPMGRKLNRRLTCNLHQDVVRMPHKSIVTWSS